MNYKTQWIITEKKTQTALRPVSHYSIENLIILIKEMFSWKNSFKYWLISQCVCNFLRVAFNFLVVALNDGSILKQLLLKENSKVGLSFKQVIQVRYIIYAKKVTAFTDNFKNFLLTESNFFFREFQVICLTKSRIDIDLDEK